MQQSTNFNFNIPEGGDLVNLLTQLIPNWTNLDGILKGVQDSTFQNATENVSLGVHAITRLNSDAKLLKWIATANFEAGDTFTIDGIATPASLPSGEALGEDCYVAGAVVIAALNADESALTVYVTTGTIAVASDSERLGGELPAYYSTKAYADSIKSTADAASDLITKKTLVNTYYDASVDKLYQVNADGTQGNEIKRFKNYTRLATHSGATASYTIPNIQNYEELLVVAIATFDNSLRNVFNIPINIIQYAKGNQLSGTSDYIMSFNIQNATTLDLYTQSTAISINVYAR